MALGSPALASHAAAVAPLCLACLLGSAVSFADDPVKSTAWPDPSRNDLFALQPAAASSKKLQLTLNEIELEDVIDRYQATHGMTEQSFLEEVTVKGPVFSVKMHDTAQEVWAGVAAPFWALKHPTQAWRILLPIPPKTPEGTLTSTGERPL